MKQSGFHDEDENENEARIAGAQRSTGPAGIRGEGPGAPPRLHAGQARPCPGRRAASGAS